jgi:hypothetical protein
MQIYNYLLESKKNKKNLQSGLQQNTDLNNPVEKQAAVLGQVPPG